MVIAYGSVCDLSLSNICVVSRCEIKKLNLKYLGSSVLAMTTIRGMRSRESLEK